jgi:hypothetical protein
MQRKLTMTQISPEQFEKLFLQIMTQTANANAPKTAVKVDPRLELVKLLTSYTQAFVNFKPYFIQAELIHGGEFRTVSRNYLKAIEDLVKFADSLVRKGD